MSAALMSSKVSSGVCAAGLGGASSGGYQVERDAKTAAANSEPLFSMGQLRWIPPSLEALVESVAAFVACPSPGALSVFSTNAFLLIARFQAANAIPDMTRRFSLISSQTHWGSPVLRGTDLYRHCKCVLATIRSLEEPVHPSTHQKELEDKLESAVRQNRGSDLKQLIADNNVLFPGEMVVHQGAWLSLMGIAGRVSNLSAVDLFLDEGCPISESELFTLTDIHEHRILKRSKPPSMHLTMSQLVILVERLVPFATITSSEDCLKDWHSHNAALDQMGNENPPMAPEHSKRFVGALLRAGHPLEGISYSIFAKYARDLIYFGFPAVPVGAGDVQSESEATEIDNSLKACQIALQDREEYLRQYVTSIIYLLGASTHYSIFDRGCANIVWKYFYDRNRVMTVDERFSLHADCERVASAIFAINQADLKKSETMSASGNSATAAAAAATASAGAAGAAQAEEEIVTDVAFSIDQVQGKLSLSSEQVKKIKDFLRFCGRHSESIVRKNVCLLIMQPAPSKEQEFRQFHRLYKDAVNALKTQLALLNPNVKMIEDESAEFLLAEWATGFCEVTEAARKVRADKHAFHQNLVASLEKMSKAVNIACLAAVLK